MNFLKRRKKSAVEPIYKAGGKIVLMSFDGLNPADFPYNDLTQENIGEQSSLLSCDGKLYINSAKEGYEYIWNIFGILVHETRYALEQYTKRYKKQFPDVNFSNWGELQESNEEKANILAALLVPAEVKRREIERAYYSKK